MMKGTLLLKEQPEWLKRPLVKLLVGLGLVLLLFGCIALASNVGSADGASITPHSLACGGVAFPPCE
jgi:hypothetical protein